MNRSKNLDLLKIIACIMVIVIHVSGIYVKSNLIEMNSDYYVGHLWYTFSKTAVSIFIMVSGSLILNNQTRESWRNNTIKTFNAIIKPTVAWSIIYIIYNMINGLFLGDTVQEVFIDGIKSIIVGRPYGHLWYLYMIIPIYLLTPILLKIKKRLSFEKFFLLTFLILNLGLFLEVSKELFPISILNSVMWLRGIKYLGYFMLGNVLITFFEKSAIKKKIYIIVGIVLFLTSSILVFIFTNYEVSLGNDGFYWHTSLSPLIVVATASLFMIFANLKISMNKIDVVRISSHTFTIYFVHQLIIDEFNKIIFGIGKIFSMEIMFDPIWYIPFMTALIFILSLLFSIFCNKFFLEFNYKNQNKNLLN